MNYIELNTPTRSDTPRMESLIDKEQSLRKQVASRLIGNGGILVSVFLCFLTAIVVTTDVSLSLASLKSLSTDFFLLLFCTYASYVCCADSGTKAGRLSKIYQETYKKFIETKQGIINNKTHCILGDFCKDYIATELKNAKTYYLVTAGIDYEEYIREYSSKDDDDIDALDGLTAVQKKAIMSANAVKPIKLYPEQIMRHGGSNIRHSPLSFSPESRALVTYIVKFVSGAGIAIGVTLTVLNDVAASNWTVFVMLSVRLGSVLYNCFSGYKSGYENIVIHSVRYMEEQISLMQQAIIYAENAERLRTNESKSEHISVDSSGTGADHSES